MTRKYNNIHRAFPLLTLAESIATAQPTMVLGEFHENHGSVIASHNRNVINAAYGKQLVNRRSLGDFRQSSWSARFANKKIESNLEAFLFTMGVISATLSSAWSAEVIHEGLVAPINITLAVLGAGVLFHYLRSHIDRAMRRVLITVPLSVIVCVGIIVLGLASSVISAIIAALLLVEFITVLPLHRHAEVNLTIIACFAIGLGAALTPLGEPLSTIVVSKLSGPPYHATFFYLAKLLGFYIVPAVIVLGIAAIFLVHEKPEDEEASLAAEEQNRNTERGLRQSG